MNPEDLIWASRYSGPARAATMARFRVLEKLGLVAEGLPTVEELQSFLERATKSVPFIHDMELVESIHKLIAQKPDSLDAWEWFYKPMAIAAVLAHTEYGGTLDLHCYARGLPVAELIAIIKSTNYGLFPSDAVLTARCEHFLLQLAQEPA